MAVAPDGIHPATVLVCARLVDAEGFLQDFEIHVDLAGRDSGTGACAEHASPAAKNFRLDTAGLTALANELDEIEQHVANWPDVNRASPARNRIVGVTGPRYLWSRTVAGRGTKGRQLASAEVEKVRGDNPLIVSIAATNAPNGERDCPRSDDPLPVTHACRSETAHVDQLFLDAILVLGWVDPVGCARVL
ncbi:MAG: hypothetical protein ACRDQ7_10915, partial [Haloechinothrix sp.]